MTLDRRIPLAPFDLGRICDVIAQTPILKKEGPRPPGATLQ